MRVHLFLESSWEEKKNLVKQFEERAAKNNILVVQRGPNLSTGGMYDTTQCNELFKDGDLFVCNSGKTVGFLDKAWPIALYGETGYLDLFVPEKRDELIAQRAGLAEAAKALAEDMAMSTAATVKKSGPREDW